MCDLSLSSLWPQVEFGFWGTSKPLGEEEADSVPRPRPRDWLVQSQAAWPSDSTGPDNWPQEVLSTGRRGRGEDHWRSPRPLVPEVQSQGLGLLHCG